MKTKIVYISGKEVFEMADIRAAFDSVRDTLGLGTDTVLFGVPVDKEDSLTAVDTQPQPVVLDAAPAQDVLPQDTETRPVQKKSRARKPAKETVENESDTSNQVNPVADVADNEKVVPILSVLATKTEEETPEQEVSVAECVTVAEDSIPESDDEKNLEALLDSMTPLREDLPVENLQIETSTAEPTTADSSIDTDDTDETLAKLASEFAKTEDKIAQPAKNTGRGKISKLKNILPFKKVRHDDSGLMGDLFGWAGVAANDEEFSMPEFFTGVGAKR